MGRRAGTPGWGRRAGRAAANGGARLSLKGARGRLGGRGLHPHPGPHHRPPKARGSGAETSPHKSGGAPKVASAGPGSWGCLSWGIWGDSLGPLGCHPGSFRVSSWGPLGCHPGGFEVSARVDSKHPVNVRVQMVPRSPPQVEHIAIWTRCTKHFTELGCLPPAPPAQQAGDHRVLEGRSTSAWSPHVRGQEGQAPPQHRKTPQREGKVDVGVSEKS